jgi:CRP-like cAMP-binding protein
MPGQGVVDQWDSAKTFYIVLDGAVAVKSEERHLRDLGPGDFFGEFAALDWGAGYSYARTASVVASMPTRLLAVPGAVLDELYRTVPDVEGQIQAAMRERAAPG